MKGIFASIAVLVVLGLIMLITKYFSNYLSAELSRKIIHITMGLTALPFPFVFQSRISVVILGVVAIGLLWLMRSVKALRNGIGTALLGVKRGSYGEIYFTLSIVIIFVMRQSAVEYLVPIAVLTFADSFAALVGTCYGRHNMASEQEDIKTTEGSTMFFIVAFICSLLLLQLMTEIGLAKLLSISFLIAILTTIIEAVSTDGNDNLLIPLLAFGFLRYNYGRSLNSLFTGFVVMILLLLVMIVAYKIANISKLSVAYGLLVGYIIIVQGGIVWLLPPFALILGYVILPKLNVSEKQRTLSCKVIECYTIVGVFCLWMAIFFPQEKDIFYLAYSFSFACHLAINSYSRFTHLESLKQPQALIYGGLKGVVLVAFPTLLFTKMNGWMFLLYLVLLALSLLLAIVLNKKYDYKRVNITRTRANEALVGMSTAIFSILGGLLS